MRIGWVGWLVVALVVVGAALSLDPARLGLSTTTPFAQLIAVRGALAVLLGLATAVTLLCASLVRHRGEQRPTRLLAASVVLAAAAATHGTVVLARGTASDEALPPGKAAVAIDILVFNTFGGATGNADVAALIDKHRPDVVALPETNTSSANDIATRSDDRYDVFVGFGIPGATAPTALLINESLGEYVRIDGHDTDYGMVGAKPVTRGGPVVYAVHAISPVGERMSTWRSDLKLLGEICSGTPGVIMAGDFNATLDHQPMRDNACVDGSVGAQGRGTWPADIPALLGAPIDHVLVDPETWRPVASAVLEVPGSDHRAIVVRVEPAG